MKKIGDKVETKSGTILEITGIEIDISLRTNQPVCFVFFKTEDNIEGISPYDEFLLELKKD